MELYNYLTKKKKQIGIKTTNYNGIVQLLNQKEKTNWKMKTRDWTRNYL